MGDPAQIQVRIMGFVPVYLLYGKQIASALVHQHGTQVRAQVSKDSVHLPTLSAAGLTPAGDPWGPEYLFYTLGLQVLREGN